ncbi:MAG TPA: sodium/proline symporter [Woeseiaceae bacterium]|nr:sodium/proline symporter [Woeseiaceae bacterium]
MSVTIISFVLILLAITATGAMSVIHKRRHPRDYLVASRRIPPWLSALSTVATNNSGFMFIGMIAYTYRLGIEAVWMMVGWVLGDMLMWLFVHPRVRRASADEDTRSLPGMVGTRLRDGTVMRPVVVLAGLITIVFLGVYAAGQLKAGSTALHALFGWDMWVGAVIGTAIVILYSYAGGIRADIWTDAAQSFAMIISMAMILGAGAMEIGGWDALMDNLRAQDPSLVRWMPDELAFGLLPFITGFMFAGISAAGQPHLMTRIMAIESVDSIPRAGFYYFAWYIPFFVASIGVGLYCRAIIPDIATLPLAEGLREPTELALPLITMRLLPEFFVGLALAGLFAATISTADSQIIVCSGAMTQDVRPRWQNSYLASKLATFSVAGLALGIALYAPEGVFGLVLIAWSALGASLTPVLVLQLFGRPPGTATALAMMIAAVATVSFWHLSPWNDDVFKALPGAVAAVLVYGTARLAALARR